MGTVRFAQFNASLNRNAAGQMQADLATRNNTQIAAVAEVIQRLNPDVLLINEFDFEAVELDAAFLPANVPSLNFRRNYLNVSQNGAGTVDYPFVYIAPSNTGIASGFDLNNNGQTVVVPGTPGYGEDALGFGNFPGQFGMLLLSKFPIDAANVRTFQTFLWKDMPGNLLTNDPTPGANNLRNFYSPAEQNILRLSSKSHWDVPLITPNGVVHVLASHPTPPVFDGPEDRNGKRNHDEIRFWADYVSGRGDYIYDDRGRRGGLPANARFVIMGDQNADPFDGDSFDNAIKQLLDNPRVNNTIAPSAPGGVQQVDDGGLNPNHRGNPAFDTADFGDTAPGNLRADYVLPSRDMAIRNAGVFWPLRNDPLFRLVGERGSATVPQNPPGGPNNPTSDHSAVFVDVDLAVRNPDIGVRRLTFLGQNIFPPGANILDSRLGGLSGLAYDAPRNRFYALSDDRSQFGPARFYTAVANLGSATTFGPGSIGFTAVTALRDGQGATYPLNSVDFEGMAMATANTVWVSSEGEVFLSNNPEVPSRVTPPFIAEYNLETGREIRRLPVPRKFTPVVEDTNNSGRPDAGDTLRSGVRNNLAFESLTLTPDRRFLFTATENALAQDGPAATVSNGSPARILKYDVVTGQPIAEFLYEVEPVAQAPVPPTAFNTNGLVELLALDNAGSLLLALERSFSAGVPGTGNSIKLYEVRLDGATDISGIDRLITADRARIQPAQKRLLLDFDTLRLPTGLDNVEAMAIGPVLPDGRLSLILASDDNFNATQFTQFLTFAVELGGLASNFRFNGGFGSLGI